MRKLVVFNHVSLDGYFTDAKNDMSWAHKQDAEWNAFAEGNAASGGMLLFGRVTYDLMSSYWPTPAALQQFPKIAERMNTLPKVVFSRTMDKASWKNTELAKGDPATVVRTMKESPGPDMAIMGSGTIVSLLAQAGLIDVYQIVVNPIVLGKGRTMFESVTEKMPLKLTESRTFGNGNALHCYEPVKWSRV
jgi:dihydrofolate reductase